MDRGRLLFTTNGHGNGGYWIDRYFDDITVDQVGSEKEGWKIIGDKPMLWGSNL